MNRNNFLSNDKNKVPCIFTRSFAVSRSAFKRSLSDGNILCESNSPMVTSDVKQKDLPLAETRQEGCKGLSDSTPEISTCETDLTYSRLLT